MQSLQPNSTLQGGKYKIISVLGQGGFGITYLAYHEMLECKVAIKEFFFKEYCDRDSETSHVTISGSNNREMVERFQQKFVKEAKTIFKLHHPHIIQIYDIFTENDTAYYVMEYVDGKSLGEIVKEQGPIKEDIAINYIKDVGSALSYIHSMSINHLDVKPNNIMTRESDQQVILIDFGVAKQYDATTKEGTTTTPVGVSHGYSPLEQYRSNGVQEFSPQSDVYALAATLFKLLTGTTPPEAIEVQEEGLPLEEFKKVDVCQKTIDAIDAAMQSRKKRTQSIDAFIAALGDSFVNEPIIVKSEEKNPPTISSEETQIISVEVEDRFKELDPSTLEFNVNGVKFKMIKVEGGTFDMKEDVSSGFLGLSTKEVTQQVTLSDYWIGETQVTQALYRAVMEENPSYFKGENKPVETIKWNDCQKFIKKLNNITGKQFRLLTEAEWEFAAQGGINGHHYKFSGSDEIDDVAWYSGNSNGTTHDVAIKQPNELGIYDMSGNVWEWCSDRFGHYKNDSLTNPVGAEHGSLRVIRGGSWIHIEGLSRLSYRDCCAPENSDYYIGLRLSI